VVVTRESSPGPVGRFLCSVIEGREARLSEPTMALLFAADRLDHLERDILSALGQGIDVISDRYYHSSLAYQGSATEPAWVRMLNGRALAPDVTYVLELPVEVAMLRRRARNDDLELYDDQTVQQRVAEVYRRLGELLPHELLVRIEGTAELSAVTNAVVIADLEHRGWL
jgi:dTMP kinase